VATAPGVPTGVTATANGVSGQVVVAWVPPASDGGSAIIDYQVNVSGYLPITGIIDGYNAVVISALTDGTSCTFTVQARNAIGLSAISAPALASSNAASFHIRINAGGPAYTDGSSNIWAADSGFTGGTATSDPGGVTSTPDPGLFLWERRGATQYQFTGLANGTYRVDLLMAEQTWTGAGQRVMSATANGQAIYTDLDVFTAAGCAFKAITRGVDVVVNGGTLTIGLTATVDASSVNAIHIFLPTTGINSSAASLSAATSLLAIGRGVSTGAKALTATATLQASASGSLSPGIAGLIAHATLSAVSVTSGPIDVGSTLAYTVTNLLPHTLYGITVDAYDAVGVHGTASALINVTTLTTTPAGAGNLTASSVLFALGRGAISDVALLQSTASLIATAGGPVKPGSAALAGSATLSATPLGAGPIAAAANLAASATISALGRGAIGGTATLQASTLLVATAYDPIKLGSATLLSTAFFSVSISTGTFGDGTFGGGTFGGGSGPIVASAAPAATSALFATGFRIATASVAATATSQLTATGIATSAVDLVANSTLAATAATFAVGPASALLVSTSTLGASTSAATMIASAPLVALASLFGDPTGAATRLGSADLLAGSTLYAATVATVRTGSAALAAAPSSLGAIGTRFVYVPPIPPAVFAMPRLIVEVAVMPGPNLDAKKTGTANALTLNDPSTSLGTSVLGSIAVWTDITSDVLHLDLFYGRSSGPLSELVQPLVGSANITLENFSGNYDPANPNGTFADGVGGTLLLPLRQVQIRAEWAGITYPLWRGYVEEYVPDYGAYPTTTMQCVGPLAILAAAPIPKVDPDFGGERSGARIARILDRINWPTSLRDIDTGKTILPTTVYGDNALKLSQDIATAEGGLIFSSAQTGSIVFYDRTRLYNRSQALSTQATFSDAGTNNTIDYLALVVSYGAATIVNSVTLSRTDGIAQTVEDVPSQVSYGKRELPNAPTGLQLTSDNQAQALANWYLQQYKDPGLRISEISLDGLPQEMWPAVLGLALWDRVDVSRRYSPSYSFDKQVLVQGITHTIVPYQSWAVKLNTQAPPTFAPYDFPPMILNTSSGVGVGCLAY
jgi:hypothetical protein